MALFQKFLFPSGIRDAEELGKRKVDAPALSPDVNLVPDALNRLNLYKTIINRETENFI